MNGTLLGNTVHESRIGNLLLSAMFLFVKGCTTFKWYHANNSTVEYYIQMHIKKMHDHNPTQLTLLKALRKSFFPLIKLSAEIRSSTRTHVRNETLS